MTQQKISIGAKVKVVDQGSPEYGRTAKVIGEAPDQAPGRWLVAFEYPLGGVPGRAVLREEQLQVAPRL